MKVKFHLTPNGDPGQCTASSRNCPYGGEEEHYATPEAARHAFEQTMKAEAIPAAIKTETRHMRLVGSSDVDGEMELAVDVPSASGPPLLKAGVILTEARVERLRAAGIHTLWVKDHLSEGLEVERPLPEDVRKAAERVVSSCLTEMENSTEQMVSRKTVEEVRRSAQAMVEVLQNYPDAIIRLDNLATADSYSYAHSVRVATLGLMLGHRVLNSEGWVDEEGKRHYDKFDERLVDLGTGLLLHDIGKARIPDEILNKEGKLSDEEFELVKTHTTLGAQMLDPTHLSPQTISVVRSHHEKWDGTGYPDGKAGGEIPQFARIAAIADVYDAVTSERPYKKGAPPWAGVDVIRKGAGTHFDPALVKLFSKIVHPYPVGTSLSLPGGGVGVVTHVDAGRSEYPTVRYRKGGRLIERELWFTNGECQTQL